MTGALYRYLREAEPRHFQPMNANFGLLDDLAEPVRDKKLKRANFAERALDEIAAWSRNHGIIPAAGVAPV
jgi:methylenetetrahydrofolate--tRNA-(uracil-5-)-methyltransferase